MNIDFAKTHIASSSNTQRDDQSLGKLTSAKVSLSQLKRNFNGGLMKAPNGSLSFKKSEHIKTNESKIFEKKEQ